MNTKLTDEAILDKEKLSEKEWKQVKEKIKDATESLSHEDLKIVPNPFLNHPVWQLTIEETDTSYRAYIDVKNGKTVVIAIWDFEFTHSGDQHWKELEERM